MKKIAKYLVLKKRMTFSQSANGILYFLRSLPLLKKLIPEKVYQFPMLKKGLAIFGFVCSVLFSLFAKFFYVLVMLCLPVSFILQGGQGTKTGVLIVFTLFSGLLGTLINNTTQPQKKDYYLLRLMHMDARTYVFSQWFMTYGVEAVFLLFAFAVCFFFFQIPLWYALIMLLYYEGTHFLSERIHIKHSLTHEKALSSYYGVLTLCYCVITPLAYGLVYLLPYSMQFNTFMLLLMSGVGIVSLWIAIPYLKSVDYANVMSEGFLRQQKFILNDPNKEALIQSVELQDKDYEKTDFKAANFANKHGYEYLNALFFQRHKRLFIRPMCKAVIGILAFFIIANVVLYFMRGEATMPERLLTMFSPMLMLLYFLSMGEKITRALFYNCDVSLLRYGYYRQPDAIITNFRIRLRKIVQMNMLLSVLICVGFMSIIWMSAAQYTIQEQCIFYASILSASIFFSVHHLSLYYIIQPYSGELEMKSPMFTIINSIVYMLCYGAMMIDTNDIIVIIILVTTLIYSIVVVFTVYKIAYRTFRIR